MILDPPLLAAYCANLFGVAAQMGVYFFVALFLQAAMGLSATGAGLYFLPTTFSGLVGSLGGGWTVPRGHSGHPATGEDLVPRPSRTRGAGRAVRPEHAAPAALQAGEDLLAAGAHRRGAVSGSLVCVRQPGDAQRPKNDR